jgi:uncharacterized lipoprotein YmbA
MNMTKRWGRWGIGFMTLLIAACATGPRISTDQLAKAQAAPANRIVLLRPTEPNLYVVQVLNYNLHNPGITMPGRLVGGGMIGALEATSSTSHNHRLTNSLHAAGFKISDELTQDLKHQLEQAGYEVIVANQSPNAHFRGHEYLGQYPITNPPANFYLHVIIEQAGFVEVRPGTPMVPMVKAAVMLVSLTGRGHETPSSGMHQAEEESEEGPALLYHAHFTYGGPVPVEGPLDMPADPAYSFRDHGDIENPNRTVPGLKAGAQGIAKMITANLK